MTEPEKRFTVIQCHVYRIIDNDLGEGIADYGAEYDAMIVTNYLNANERRRQKRRKGKRS